MTAETKPWYCSRTLWANALVAALVTLEGVSGALQPHLPMDFYTAVAVGLPILNAVLRVVTTEGIRT